MVAMISGNSLGLSLSSLSKLGNDGVSGVADLGREKAYINIANGNLVLQDQDSFLQAIGLDAVTVRTYNSQARLNGQDGQDGNWRIGFYRSVQDQTGTLNIAGSTISRTDGDGATAIYYYSTDKSAYINTESGGSYDSLSYDSASRQWTWLDGATHTIETYDFIAGTGKLLSQQDSSGNRLSFAYNGKLLAEVVTASGEKTVLDYENGRLSAIHSLKNDGSTETRVRYSYDNLGRLSQVTLDLTPQDNRIDDGKTYVTRYAYDGDSERLTQIAQTDGSKVDFGYSLLAGNWRITSVTQTVDGLARTTTYDYSDITNAVAQTVAINTSKLSTIGTQVSDHLQALDPSRVVSSVTEQINVTASVDSKKLVNNEVDTRQYQSDVISGRLSTTEQQVNHQYVRVDQGKLISTEQKIVDHADNIDRSKLVSTDTRLEAHTGDLVPTALQNTETQIRQVDVNVDSSKLANTEGQLIPHQENLNLSLLQNSVTVDQTHADSLRAGALTSTEIRSVSHTVTLNTAVLATTAIKITAKSANVVASKLITTETIVTPTVANVDSSQLAPDYFVAEKHKALLDRSHLMSAATPAQQYYVVNAGDTWESITTYLYNVTQAQLADAAKALQTVLKNVKLSPAQKLSGFPDTLNYSIQVLAAPSYLVKTGDTWASITKTLFNATNATALKMAMGNRALPAVGKMLVGVPSTLNYSVTTVKPVEPYYLVKTGDSWGSICSALYRTSETQAIDALQALMTNAFPSLSAGIKLTGLPVKLAYQISSTITTKPYYLVQSDDTWASISLKLYGTLEAANALQSSRGTPPNPPLAAGSKFFNLKASLIYKLNEEVNVTPYYQVKQGDSWQNIAKLVYGSSAPEAGLALQKLLGKPALTAGKKLTNFPASLSYTAREVVNVAPFYVVPAGASWSSITSALYGSNSIDAANALQLAMGNASLQAGQHLTQLPINLTYSTGAVVSVPPFYQVQADDSWSSIALALYGNALAADELQAAMGNPSLSSGVKLQNLPAQLHFTQTVEGVPVPPYYRITINDTWQHIAQTLYGLQDADSNTLDAAGHALELLMGHPNLLPSAKLTNFPSQLNYTVAIALPAYYRVGSNDSWASICNTLYHTTDAAAVAALQAAMGAPALTAGSALYNLPDVLQYTTTSIQVPPYYRVAEGDSWQSITAHLYGVSAPEAISALQAVMGNPVLSADLKLTGLPQTLHYVLDFVQVPAYYRIQTGDTWASIAAYL